MAVAVKNCNGVRIYLGMSFGFHEFTTSNLKRMTDQEWAAHLINGPTPAKIPWLAPVQAP